MFNDYVLGAQDTIKNEKVTQFLPLGSFQSREEDQH